MKIMENLGITEKESEFSLFDDLAGQISDHDAK